MKKRCIALCCSGTFGHLGPSLTLAKELTASGYRVLLIGVDLKSKLRRFYGSDLQLDSIHSVLGARFSKKNIVQFLLYTFIGVLQSLYVFIKHRPIYAISFGSFYAFPPMLAARVLQVPYALYEPNVHIGQMHRFFSKGASLFASPIERREKASKLVQPLSTHFHQFAVTPPSLKLKVLCFGGSQGAQFFLDWMETIYREVVIKHHGSIYWITGHEHYKEAVEKFSGHDHLEMRAYENEMPKQYEKASFAISRSGALTLQELTEFKLPAILVPFPYAKEEHQLKNAAYYSNMTKGFKVIEQERLSDHLLHSVLQDMVQNFKTYKTHLSEYLQAQSKRQSFVSLIQEDLGQL